MKARTTHIEAKIWQNFFHIALSIARMLRNAVCAFGRTTEAQNYITNVYSVQK